MPSRKILLNVRVASCCSLGEKPLSLVTFFAAAKKVTRSRSEWKPYISQCLGQPSPASQGRERKADSEPAEAIRQRLHRRAATWLQRRIEEAKILLALRQGACKQGMGEAGVAQHRT